MSTVRRRINSTGRKRIPRDRVSVTILPVKPDEPLRATATVRLDGLGFAEDASVVLEAYQGSSAMRFELGTVAAYSVPDPVILHDLDPGAVPLFRLKVVDNDGQAGKLLGAAERLRPDSDDTPDGRESLFPVRFVELRDEVWKLQIDAAGPCMLLNFGIPTLKARIVNDPLVGGILLAFSTNPSSSGLSQPDATNAMTTSSHPSNSPQSGYGCDITCRRSSSQLAIRSLSAPRPCP